MANLSRFVLRVDVPEKVGDDVERYLERIARRLPGATLGRAELEDRGTAGYSITSRRMVVKRRELR